MHHNIIYTANYSHLNLAALPWNIVSTITFEFDNNKIPTNLTLPTNSNLCLNWYPVPQLLGKSICETNIVNKNLDQQLLNQPNIDKKKTNFKCCYCNKLYVKQWTLNNHVNKYHKQ